MPAIVWAVFGLSVSSALAAGGYWYLGLRAAEPVVRSALPAPVPSTVAEAPSAISLRPPSNANRVTLPVPSDRHPWKGVKDASVTVEVFGDLMCPYTRRVVPTLERLIVEFPQKVKVVWRSSAIADVRLSRPALRVALEVFAERGPGAFWSFQESIDGELSLPDGLRPEEIVRHAVEQKVTPARARKAFDGDDALDDVIEGDTELARANGFTETPVTVINGIVIRGVQPAHDFQNAVRRAVAELELRKEEP